MSSSCLTGTTVDISHWTLGDLNNPTDYRIPDNRDIDADEEITYPHTTIGFSINDSNETIYLMDDEGNTIIPGRIKEPNNGIKKLKK